MEDKQLITQLKQKSAQEGDECRTVEKAPVILFTYNRPTHTRQLLKTLLANPLASQTDLYVYSDAARNETDEIAVKAVRDILHRVKGFRTIRIVEREQNCGLAQNIIDGVTDVVNRHDRVIVVEDDLVLAPHFLQFMNDALDTFADRPEVGHVHACEFTLDPSIPETFLIRWTGSWGWATWKRAWQHFNPDGKALLAELERRQLTREFDFDGSYGYTRMLRRQTEGKNHSWAIRWNATLFLAGMLSFNAGRSLVQNMGFDGSGTNCGDDGQYATRLYTERIRVDKNLLMEENAVARRAMIQYYRRTNSFKSKAIRRLKKEIKNLWKIS